VFGLGPINFYFYFFGIKKAHSEKKKHAFMENFFFNLSHSIPLFQNPNPLPPPLLAGTTVGALSHRLTRFLFSLSLSLYLSLTQ
jgi:hypothetical protein